MSILPVPPALLAFVLAPLALRRGFALSRSASGAASPTVRADWRLTTFSSLSLSLSLSFCDAAPALLAPAEALSPSAVGAVQAWVVARAASPSPLPHHHRRPEQRPCCVKSSSPSCLPSCLWMLLRRRSHRRPPLPPPEVLPALQGRRRSRRSEELTRPHRALLTGHSAIERGDAISGHSRHAARCEGSRKLGPN